MNDDQTEQLLAHVASKDSVQTYLAESAHPVGNASLKELGPDNVGKLTSDLFAEMSGDKTAERKSYNDFLERENEAARAGSALKGYAFGL